MNERWYMRDLFVFVLLTVFIMVPSSAFSLSVGDRAPLFEAPSTKGLIRLSDYQGKQHVVLALYFVDFTPV